jgi:hypothetical protein
MKDLEKMLRKRKELKKILYPVDFDLAQIEKRDFMQLESEKYKAYIGLKDEVSKIGLMKVAERLKLEEARAKLNEFSSASVDGELEKAKSEVSLLEKEVGDLQRKLAFREDEKNVTFDNYFARHLKMKALEDELKLLKKKRKNKLK